MTEPVHRPALRATCWGTRGSIATPGPRTLRYGGNTPCLEVRPAGGACLVFDSGTGIRSVGRRLRGAPLRAHLFLTHYHWDHIQGFPFFVPVFFPTTHVTVHGPADDGDQVRRALAGQMTELYFPVPLHALDGKLDYAPMGAEPWNEDGVEVAAFTVKHPGVTLGYRVRAAGASLAYVPDNDLGEGAKDPAWYAAFVEFLRGVDLLFHDCMFSDEEYDRFAGWGHSSFSQSIRLAEDAGVRCLSLFHHAPEHSDDELDRFAGELRDALSARGSALELAIAAEGQEIVLPGGVE